MKKLLLIISLVMFVHMAQAQSKSVDALYQKYKANDDFFHMDIGGNFMNFAEGFNVKLDEAKVEGIVKSLERVKLFKLPENSPTGQAEFKTLYKALEKEKYELMMETSDKGNGILIFTKGDRMISDVVVLLNDKGGDLMVVELLGNFDSKSLAEAGKSMK
ncbi:DUF4252 domain-containing protein [Aquiflexum sp. LQ15W]|uniref:DUF4252 domain-containing protein n=1 Tax=Cognataquiflexum nitidum TaxID=2922272 RepID=UPI001F144893|nr:DUF4252 domain-containing protein [Cognataquiflexum nitidum]MCH6198491.1 DUF4252 domain-containing protein [Cognataquiflexum nitidum]